MRRQQVADTLGHVVKRMLAKKVPKLVKYVGNEARVLLERRHMNLAPQQILDEIEKRRASFPVLKHR